MIMKVLEMLDNGMFLISEELDGKYLGEKEIDFSDLGAEIDRAYNSPDLTIIFKEDVEMIHIDIDYAEEEGQTYLVNVSKFIYNDTNKNPDFKEIDCFEYKTEKGAINKAKQLVEQYRESGKLAQRRFNFQ